VLQDLKANETGLYLKNMPVKKKLIVKESNEEEYELPIQSLRKVVKESNEEEIRTACSTFKEELTANQETNTSY
jgi:hypothetical protein